jgi:peptidoglycan/xylan/chitin deacetylase (PgdA/CDA1 family)
MNEQPQTEVKADESVLSRPVFVHNSDVSNPMLYRIPKRIIQTGKQVQQPLQNRAMMANIRLLNPDYEYLFFDDDGVRKFIEQEFPQHRQIFDSFRFPIQRYDFFRYLAVYRYGGFYLDLDIMLASGLSSLLDCGCVFPFEGLTLSTFLRSHHEMDWEIGNYAFGAAPGHPFLEAVIENCVRAQKEPSWVKPMMRGLPFLFRDEYLVLNTTGPGLLSRTLAENAELAQTIKVLFPDDVCDVRNSNRFGDLGVHLMDGSWRTSGSRTHRRLAQRWENWKMRGLLKQSLRLGKTRNQAPRGNSSAACREGTSKSISGEKTAGRLTKGVSRVLATAQGRYQRATAHYLGRRPFTINPGIPIISFTFDDFPRSALLTGGAILQSLGLSGTYYASLGLIGKRAATGTMFLEEDLKALVEEGHELGCHTFGHCHAWDTSPREFEEAIISNRQALRELIPRASFETLSYPISVPRARTKRRVSKYFACCRCGGQTFNVGKVDLNYLSAYFLEQSRDNPEAIKQMVDQNRRAGGWLIFATHDVCKDPTRWGCTPDLFEDIVRYSVNSGARILPVFQAYEALRATSSE